ncbi:MAG: hypothetical protein ABR582_10955 [Gemmatimonadaceae bacterium]
MTKNTDAYPRLRTESAKEAFRFVLPMDLPGFAENPKWYGGLGFRSRISDPMDVQYERFRNRVIAVIGREYLPVYRMADGEFGFMAGQRKLTRDRASLRRHLIDEVRIRIRGGSHRTCWGEEYTAVEMERGKQIFLQSLERVAECGVIAAYFAVRGDGWGEAYFEPVCDWLDANHIALNDDNYVPFYFVYALLNDPRRSELYAGRHILVVTHLNAERASALERALLAEGAASVAFIPVSASKSLLDSVDLSTVSGPVDLALVAAGIGSVNILAQLEPLAIPCIDCGISLECLLDGSRRFERPFLMGDDRIQA